MVSRQNKRHLGGVFLILLIDQGSKWYARRLALADSLTDSVALTSHFNAGAAFSLPIPSWILIGLAGMLLVFLFYHYARTQTPYLRWPLVFMVAGGLSNLLDRVWYGAVFDILRIYTLYLNVADIAIMVGAIFLLYFLLYPAVIRSTV